MQKQHEEMKNQSIQNMVRNQKMDAERRKEMVSYTIQHIYFHLTFILISNRNVKKKGFSSVIG